MRNEMVTQQGKLDRVIVITDIDRKSKKAEGNFAKIQIS